MAKPKMADKICCTLFQYLSDFILVMYNSLKYYM